MRLLVILSGLAALVVGGLVIYMLADQDQASSKDDPSNRDKNSLTHPIQPDPLVRRNTLQGLLNPDDAEKREKELAQGAVDEEKVVRLGKEFEERWQKDRLRLGQAQHKIMEQLWFEGRRPRGDPQAIEKLEKLIEEFPDTNRAGCAAYELGHHFVRNRQLNLEERRKKAEKYWIMVDEHYSDTLCEYNSHASAMSKFSLASWVYRYTNPAMARRLLEEIVEQHKGETDHRGQSLEVIAKRLMKQLE